MPRSDSTVREVTNENFPHSGSRESQLRFLLRYALLAPSHYNIQPWKFSISGQSLELMLDTTRIANIVDPQGREVTISCGAAIKMIEIAARYYGYLPKVHFPSDKVDNYLAQIELQEGFIPSMQDKLLFNAIKRRQTNRRWFDDAPVPEKIIKRCVIQVENLSTQVNFFCSKETRARFASLTEIAVKQQYSQPWFRQELSSWLRPGLTARTDGMTSYGFFSTKQHTPLAKAMLKFFDSGKQIALFNKQKIVDGSPTLCVLSTHGDNVLSWLNTGRALSSVLLSLATAGFSASFMNQAIQEPMLRTQVSDLFCSAPYPQLVLRIGYAKNVAWTPRRNVKDCLV